jgi:hypothetical protein
MLARHNGYNLFNFRKILEIPLKILRIYWKVFYVKTPVKCAPSYYSWNLIPVDSLMKTNSLLNIAIELARYNATLVANIWLLVYSEIY